MDTDDSGIKYSFETAYDKGLEFCFHEIEIENSHPNTANIVLTGDNGNKVEVQGASVGGGNIVITKINGTNVEITGKFYNAHSTSSKYTGDDFGRNKRISKIRT